MIKKKEKDSITLLRQKYCTTKVLYNLSFIFQILFGTIIMKNTCYKVTVTLHRIMSVKLYF